PAPPTAPPTTLRSLTRSPPRRLADTPSRLGDFSLVIGLIFAPFVRQPGWDVRQLGGGRRERLGYGRMAVPAEARAAGRAPVDRRILCPQGRRCRPCRVSRRVKIDGMRRNRRIRDTRPPLPLPTSLTEA